MKISVIIPVYNPGVYFEECLQSVFAQTFTDFELICVNDASKDKLVLQLLETYRNKYSNMKVLHMEQNVGAGEARNRGFQVAVGEYVIFLDSDDVYAKELLERMYSKCEEMDADVCVCGYVNFDAQDEKREPISESKPNVSNLENSNKEKYLLYWDTSPWNKLCKRNFLLENNIYFQSLSSQNDVFFSLMVAKYAVKKAYITETNLIKSRRNIPTQITANKDICNVIYAVDFMVNELKLRNQYDDIVKRQLMSLLFAYGTVDMKLCKNEEKSREFYLLMQDYAKRNPIGKDHSILYIKYHNLMELPYESRWFENSMDHFWQLRAYSEELKELLQRKTAVFLWGLGKRGEAFQRFCKEEDIEICGVADKKNENIGNCTEFGNMIFSTDEVMDRNGCIVASNIEIYNELVKMRLQADVINLEEYCPI